MLRNSIILGGLLATFSFAVTMAQDGDQKENCAGLADSFNNYVENNSDPDLDSAKELAQKGIDDCNGGRFTQGIAELVTATGMLHDNQPSKWMRRQ